MSGSKRMRGGAVGDDGFVQDNDDLPIIYYNGNLSSQTSSDFGRGGKLADFTEVRTNPVVADMSKYQFSVVRAQLNTKALPLYIPLVQTGQPNPNLLNYNVGLGMTWTGSLAGATPNVIANTNKLITVPDFSSIGGIPFWIAPSAVSSAEYTQYSGTIPLPPPATYIVGATSSTTNSFLQLLLANLKSATGISTWTLGLQTGIANQPRLQFTTNQSTQNVYFDFSNSGVGNTRIVDQQQLTALCLLLGFPPPMQGLSYQLVNTTSLTAPNPLQGGLPITLNLLATRPLMWTPESKDPQTLLTPPEQPLTAQDLGGLGVPSRYYYGYDYNSFLTNSVNPAFQACIADQQIINEEPLAQTEAALLVNSLAPPLVSTIKPFVGQQYMNDQFDFTAFGTSYGSSWIPVSNLYSSSFSYNNWDFIDAVNSLGTWNQFGVVNLKPALCLLNMADPLNCVAPSWDAIGSPQLTSLGWTSSNSQTQYWGVANLNTTSPTAIVSPISSRTVPWWSYMLCPPAGTGAMLTSPGIPLVYNTTYTLSLQASASRVVNTLGVTVVDASSILIASAYNNGVSSSGWTTITYTFTVNSVPNGLCRIVLNGISMNAGDAFKFGPISMTSTTVPGAGSSYAPCNALPNGEAASAQILSVLANTTSQPAWGTQTGSDAQGIGGTIGLPAPTILVRTLTPWSTAIPVGTVISTSGFPAGWNFSYVVVTASSTTYLQFANTNPAIVVGQDSGTGGTVTSFSPATTVAYTVGSFQGAPPSVGSLITITGMVTPAFNVVNALVTASTTYTLTIAAPIGVSSQQTSAVTAFSSVQFVPPVADELSSWGLVVGSTNATSTAFNASLASGPVPVQAGTPVYVEFTWAPLLNGTTVGIAPSSYSPLYSGVYSQGSIFQVTCGPDIVYVAPGAALSTSVYTTVGVSYTPSTSMTSPFVFSVGVQPGQTSAVVITAMKLFPQFYVPSNSTLSAYVYGAGGGNTNTLTVGGGGAYIAASFPPTLVDNNLLTIVTGTAPSSSPIVDPLFSDNFYDAAISGVQFGIGSSFQYNGWTSTGGKTGILQNSTVWTGTQPAVYSGCMYSGVGALSQTLTSATITSQNGLSAQLTVSFICSSLPTTWTVSYSGSVIGNLLSTAVASQWITQTYSFTTTTSGVLSFAMTTSIYTMKTAMTNLLITTTTSRLPNPTIGGGGTGAATLSGAGGGLSAVYLFSPISNLNPTSSYGINTPLVIAGGGGGSGYTSGSSGGAATSTATFPSGNGSGSAPGQGASATAPGAAGGTGGEAGASSGFYGGGTSFGGSSSGGGGGGVYGGGSGGSAGGGGGAGSSYVSGQLTIISQASASGGTSGGYLNNYWTYGVGMGSNGNGSTTNTGSFDGGPGLVVLTFDGAVVPITPNGSGPPYTSYTINEALNAEYSYATSTTTNSDSIANLYTGWTVKVPLVVGNVGMSTTYISNSLNAQVLPAAYAVVSNGMITYYYNQSGFGQGVTNYADGDQLTFACANGLATYSLNDVLLSPNVISETFQYPGLQVDAYIVQPSWNGWYWSSGSSGIVGSSCPTFTALSSMSNLTPFMAYLFNPVSAQTAQYFYVPITATVAASTRFITFQAAMSTSSINAPVVITTLVDTTLITLFTFVPTQVMQTYAFQTEAIGTTLRFTASTQAAQMFVFSNIQVTSTLGSSVYNPMGLTSLSLSRTVTGSSANAETFTNMFLVLSSAPPAQYTTQLSLSAQLKYAIASLWAAPYNSAVSYRAGQSCCWNGNAYMATGLISANSGTPDRSPISGFPGVNANTSARWLLVGTSYYQSWSPFISYPVGSFVTYGNIGYAALANAVVGTNPPTGQSVQYSTLLASPVDTTASPYYTTWTSTLNGNGYLQSNVTSGSPLSTFTFCCQNGGIATFSPASTACTTTLLQYPIATTISSYLVVDLGASATWATFLIPPVACLGGQTYYITFSIVVVATAPCQVYVAVGNTTCGNGSGNGTQIGSFPTSTYSTLKTYTASFTPGSAGNQTISISFDNAYNINTVVYVSSIQVITGPWSTSGATNITGPVLSPGITTTAPMMTYSPSSGLFSMLLDTYGFGNLQGCGFKYGSQGYTNGYAFSTGTAAVTTPVVSPFFNRNLYGTFDENLFVVSDSNFQNLFANFPQTYVGSDTTSKYSYVWSNPINPTLTPIVLSAPSTLPVQQPLTIIMTSGVQGTVFYWQITQDYSSTESAWTPIDSIVMTTQFIPVAGELNCAPAPGVDLASGTLAAGSSGNFQQSITDVSVALTAAQGYRGNTLYVPSGEYRMISLPSRSAHLDQINVAFWWRHRVTGQLFRIYLQNNENISFKLMFRPKSYSGYGGHS